MRHYTAHMVGEPAMCHTVYLIYCLQVVNPLIQWSFMWERLRFAWMHAYRGRAVESDVELHWFGYTVGRIYNQYDWMYSIEMIVPITSSWLNDLINSIDKVLSGWLSFGRNYSQPECILHSSSVLLLDCSDWLVWVMSIVGNQFISNKRSGDRSAVPLPLYWSQKFKICENSGFTAVCIRKQIIKSAGERRDIIAMYSGIDEV
jgi:hypothetical protein